MKAIFVLLLAVVLFAAGVASGQKKLVILVRHAEKDISETADKDDPPLSAEGELRAARLLKKLKKYKPGAVYSTDYKRTRSTVELIAAHRKLQIKIYDARKQGELVDEIMKSKIKRFVIAGHTNSVPKLANLLIKKDIFKSLDESEYGTIWVIRIKNGQIAKTELLQY